MRALLHGRGTSYSVAPARQAPALSVEYSAHQSSDSLTMNSRTNARGGSVTLCSELDRLCNTFHMRLFTGISAYVDQVSSCSVSGLLDSSGQQCASTFESSRSGWTISSATIDEIGLAHPICASETCIVCAGRGDKAMVGQPQIPFHHTAFQRAAGRISAWDDTRDSSFGHTGDIPDFV